MGKREKAVLLCSKRRLKHRKSRTKAGLSQQKPGRGSQYQKLWGWKQTESSGFVCFALFFSFKETTGEGSLRSVLVFQWGHRKPRPRRPLWS